MNKSEEIKNAILANRVLLGLLMLVAGLLKLFVMGPDKIVGMLAGFGFPAAGFLAWVLILSEIVFGIAILANYKLRLTTIPPMIIILLAALTANLLTKDPTNWNLLIMHLVVVTNYWIIGLKN